MTDIRELATIQGATDAELAELLKQTSQALVRRDIGQQGVYRAAGLHDRILREQERRSGTNPFNQ